MRVLEAPGFLPYRECSKVPWSIEGSLSMCFWRTSRLWGTAGQVGWVGGGDGGRGQSLKSKHMYPVADTSARGMRKAVCAILSHLFSEAGSRQDTLQVRHPGPHMALCPPLCLSCLPRPLSCLPSPRLLSHLPCPLSHLPCLLYLSCGGWRLTWWSWCWASIPWS